MIIHSIYQVSTCPRCGELMWNGQCENRDCPLHWYPLEDGKEYDPDEYDE